MANSLLWALGMKGLRKQQHSNAVRRDLRVPFYLRSITSLTRLMRPLLLGVLTMDQRELVGIALQFLRRTSIVLSAAGKVQMSFRATSPHIQYRDPPQEHRFKPPTHPSPKCTHHQRLENAPRPIPDPQTFRLHHPLQKRLRSLKRTLIRNTYCATSEPAPSANLAT